MRVKDLSLAARYEVTKKYATAYVNASKKDKSRILDQVVGVTGWNRDHARQQLRRRVDQPVGVHQPRPDGMGRGTRRVFHPIPPVQEETVESKNNHLVRRYGFYHRYDTPAELQLLNQLWPLVCDRLNYFTPTKKPIDWASDPARRRTRVYNAPRTPFQRLLDAGVLNPCPTRRTPRVQGITAPPPDGTRDQPDPIRTHPPGGSENRPPQPPNQTRCTTFLRNPQTRQLTHHYAGKNPMRHDPTSRGLDNEAPRPSCMKIA